MNWLNLLLRVAGIGAVGLLLARALFTTAVGGVFLRMVPDGFWRAAYAALGLEGAETTGNVEILVWLAICLLVAGGLVLGLPTIYRRWRQGR